jgi:LVIVD repeat
MRQSLPNYMKKMKKNLPSALWLLALFGLLFSACLEDKCENTSTYTQWNPVYKTDAELKTPPQYQAARPLKNTGKIYFYDKYILVNELKQGIHVIDNTNPAAPINVGFISIGGNVDIAVQGNYLYADNYMDLITLDISTITNPPAVPMKCSIPHFGATHNAVGSWIMLLKKSLWHLIAPTQVSRIMAMVGTELQRVVWLI